MTKKNFEAIAGLVKARLDFIARMPDRSNETRAFDRGFNAGVEGLALNMATYFEKENPNFNRAKFLEACGL